jgi:ureidoglycolate lyase
MIIQAKPLDQESFAPFGQVLMGSGKSPERIPFAAKIENHRSRARLNITYLRINPVKWPIAVEALERHLYSHQIFVPLNGTRHLVVVCSSDANGDPVWSQLQAYVAEGFQAVNYFAGTWHAPRTCVAGSGEFIMMRWDEGTDADEEFRASEGAIQIISKHAP